MRSSMSREYGGRNRLLRQPNGFEGLDATGVEIGARDLRLSDGPHGSSDHLDLGHPRLATTVIAHEDDDAVSCVDEILDIAAVTGPWSQPVAPDRPRALQPPVDNRSGAGIMQDAFAVRVEEAREHLGKVSSGIIVTEQRGEINVCARLQEPDDLHVLLRHRLPPQAHGFEGTGSVAVYRQPNDPTRSKGPDVEVAITSLGLASSNSTPVQRDVDDVLLVGMDQLRDLYSIVVEHLPVAAERFLCRFAPA